MSNILKTQDLFSSPIKAGQSPKVVLRVQGLGAIVSFKNSKILIAKYPQGKPLPRPLLITKGEYRKQMDAIIRSFESQLFCMCPTIADAMATGHSRHSLIASLLPADDSVNHIPEIHLRVEKVEVGKEGAEITIEKL